MLTPQNIFPNPEQTSQIFLQFEKLAEKLQHAPKNQAEPIGNEINNNNNNYNIYNNNYLISPVSYVKAMGSIFIHLIGIYYTRKVPLWSCGHLEDSFWKILGIRVVHTILRGNLWSHDAVIGSQRYPVEDCGSSFYTLAAIFSHAFWESSSIHLQKWYVFFSTVYLSAGFFSLPLQQTYLVILMCICVYLTGIMAI